MAGFIRRIIRRAGERRDRRLDRRNPFKGDAPMTEELDANRAMLGDLAGGAAGQYGGAYDALGQAKSGFDALAAGQGPSLAQEQLQAQSDKNIAGTIAAMGAARSGNLNANQMNAGTAGAAMQLDTNRQMAELRAQEQLAAMNASAGLAGQMAGMSSDRQMGMLGMGQGALNAQQQAQMAQIMARNGQRNANREFGLGVFNSGVGAAEAAAGIGALSDMRVKEKIKPVKSPIAMLLLGRPHEGEEGDEENCSVCGREGCEAEHETESMGRKDDEAPGMAKRLAARKAFGKLKPYEYEYNAEGKAKGMPEGKIIGIMAQDLERSEAGDDVVEEREGRKWIDPRKALHLVLAGAADHEARLAKIEKRRAV